MGRLPGDRRVRVARRRPAEFEIRPPRKVRRPTSPAVVLALGFLVLIAAGTVLLALPLASAAGTATDPVTALFTATSAVCVTGLVLVDTGAHWSAFGHVVILVLIQVGGFGFMTGSTLLLFLLVGRRTALRDRILVQASTGTPDLGSVTNVVRSVAVFTVLAEGIGAVLLAVAFLGHGRDPVTSLWWGVFHATSAFNNAGFDLFGGHRSLAGFASDPSVLVPIGVLIVLGGLGFAIVGDVAAKRRWVRLALETKIVLLTTAAVLVAGTTAIVLLEWDNPATLGALPPAQRPLNALFEATTLRTAGFSVLPTGSLLDETLFVVIALMFIGGASGSTAGGIKVNTFSVLLVAIVSTIRGEPYATALGRRISHVTIYRALAIALLSVAVVFGLAFAVAVLSPGPFIHALFESVSAVGTVGASVGLTAQASDATRVLLVAAMFVGRLGPLTFVLALAARERPVRHQPALEAIRIG